MRTLFLADAHLQQPDDSNYQRLLQFIQEQTGTVDTLCILGDLFDFRVGLPRLTFPEHEPLLAALAQLRAGGCRLIYLEGNHDFHLGEPLAQRLGAELQSGPVTLQLEGLRVHLCHGDLINPADWRYRLLYRILRHPATLRLGTLVPPELIARIRHALQRSSKGRYQRDNRRWDYRAMIRTHARKLQQQGCDALVLGHFHQPFIEQLDGFTLVSLGDWISQHSFAELCNGSFRLLNAPA